MLSKQIEGAQKKVEEMNFVSRKNVLKYDDVLNKQRTVIYEQRRAVLEGQDLHEEVLAWIDEVIDSVVTLYTTSEDGEIDLEGLVRQMQALYDTDITADELRSEVEITREALVEEFRADAQDAYAERSAEWGPEITGEVERYFVLQVVDTRWREHLENMDYLREGVHLRSMAQKDPLVEYTSEGHKMFEELSQTIREEVVFTLFHAELAPEEAADLSMNGQDGGNGAMSYEHQSLAGADAIAAANAGETAAVAAPPAPQQRQVSERDKVGRNDPCWCGSGKKYKKCHGS
jgi:preprotein translocase subunit SecA